MTIYQFVVPALVLDTATGQVKSGEKVFSIRHDGIVTQAPILRTKPECEQPRFVEVKPQ